MDHTYQQTGRIDRVVFYGIIFLLIFAPLAFGSVHVWAYTVVEIGVFLLLGLWFAGRLIFSGSDTLSWVQTPVNLILLVFLVLVGFQLVPLPASVTALISPQTYADKKQLFAILAKAPGASTDASPEMMLSYTSHATRVEWLKLAVYFGMFFLVLNTATSKQKIDILVYTMIFIGLFEAVYAVYQVFSTTPQVWWWRSRIGASRFASGTFIGSNHFAGYMEMVLCLAFGFLIAQKRHVRRPEPGLNGGGSFLKKCVIWLAPESARPKMIFFFFVTVLIGVALLLSASRGGILALGVSMLLMSILFFAKHRYRTYGGLALCLCAAVLVYGLHIGIDPTLEKFENPANLYNRFHVTRTILPMVGDYPFLGVGLGNFRYVYPRYIDDYDRVRASGYAHNDWVEAGTETGFLGLALILAGFGIYLVKMMGVWRGRRDVHALGIGAGVAAGLLSIALHSYVDFNMHIPANPLTLAALLAVGYAAVHRQSRPHGESFFYEKREIPLTRWRRLVISGLAVLVFGTAAGWAGKHFLAEAAAPTEWNSTMNLNMTPELSDIEKAITLNRYNYAYYNKRAAHFMALKAENLEEERTYLLETRKSLEQAVRRNPAMGILWYNLGRNYAFATDDMFDYVNKYLPLADRCFDLAVLCAPMDEYMLLNAGRYWVWRARMLAEGTGQRAEEQKSRRAEDEKVSRTERGMNRMGGGRRFAVGGPRLEVGGEDWKQQPQTSSEAILKPNAADPKDSGFLRKGDRTEGIRKFQAYFQRLLAINPDRWQEAVQYTRVYFPDDGVVLGIVPGDNDALKSRVLAVLAKEVF